MEYFLVETSPGVYEIEDLVNAEIDTMSSQEDIVYHFFSQRDPEAGVDITSTNIEALKSTRFSILRDTVFLIHGWKGDNDASSNLHMKEAILAKYNVNVFIVDWSVLAQKNYISAKNAVLPVGQYVASFINSLVDRYRLRLSKVGLVGFSLGAHVAGNAGAALNGEVDHIVGLDPAGPLFTVRNTDERLDPTDAKFVHVIHTNGGLLGFKQPSGHADYYPNGGSSQAGCGIDIAGTCAHSRAYAYYSEAIVSSGNDFVAKQCSSYRDYSRDRCGDNARSTMGGYTVDTG